MPPTKDAEKIEQYVVDVIRRKVQGATVSTSTDKVVADVSAKLPAAAAVEIRGAIWRLVDSNQVEFTENRRVRPRSEG